MALKFKTTRIEKEYNELPVHNGKLKRLLDMAATFVELEFAKDVVVTEIYRSEDEYKALYAKIPKENWPKSFPHAKWQSIDLRAFIYTPKELERLVNFLNQFKFRGGASKTAFVHAIPGGAAHFHIQYGLDT
jgi:hypothetical protein